jgi:GNAT superfamily N-acetyltransferase
MRIHKATAADELATTRMSASAFAELRRTYVPKVDARARAAASTSTFSRLVVDGDDGAVIGTLLYRTDGDRLHVRGLAVDPDHRRQGVARQLLESVAEIARQEGLRAVSLWTVLQTGNVAIFERLGFSVSRQERNDSMELVAGGPTTDVYMEKRVG